VGAGNFFHLRLHLIAEQGIQLASTIQRAEIVEAANVLLADKNLRNSTPPGELHHLL
jgi:hypothetical protein